MSPSLVVALVRICRYAFACCKEVIFTEDKKWEFFQSFLETRWEYFERLLALRGNFGALVLKKVVPNPDPRPGRNHQALLVFCFEFGDFVRSD